MAVKIKWKTFPNPNIRYLACDVMLWDSIHCNAYGIPLTDEQSQLLSAMEGIRGVLEIGVSKYEMRITKGDCFSWSEIQPRVESVFSEWCGMELVEYQSADKELAK